MRITESQLKRYVRQILQEKVFGNQAFIYHGSDLPPDKFSKIIESNTFEPGHGAGAMYGKGLYTVYNEDPTSETFRGGYGDFVYKLKVNLSGFLIFDSDVCVKVHGKPMSLKDQLVKMGMQDIYNIIKKAWRNLQKPSSWVQEDLTFEYFFDEGTVDLPYTSQLALVIKDYVANKVSGLIFTGRHDGKVCIVYDPSIVVLTAYSELSYNEPEEGSYEVAGRVFRPIKPGKAQIQRSAASPGDPTRHAFSSKKSVEIVMKALEKKYFKVDRSKAKAVFSGFMDDSLLGKPSETFGLATPDDPLYMWKTAASNYLSELASHDAIDPTPNFSYLHTIVNEALRMAFPQEFPQA